MPRQLSIKFIVYSGRATLYSILLGAHAMLKTTWSHLLLDAVISHLASIIAFIERLLTAIGLPHLASHVRDYYWMAAAVVLRPFSSSAPGFFERRCLARAMRVDPPLYSIEVRSVATAQVNDGKNALRGTLWLPRGEPGPFPSLIIRSPYGAQDKSAEWGQMFLAERGYAVLFQDTRGRFGSDGDFVPVEHEKEDGAATVRWVRSQPWCDGRIGVFGPSYLGFTTWAMIGACAAGELQAAIPTITQAVVRPAIFHHNGAIASELLVLWFYLIEVICLPSLPKFVANVYACWRDRRLSKAFMHAPLAELDEWLVGKPWDFFQAGVREPYDDDSPFWAQRSTLCELRKEHPECVTPPPVWIVTGLHDFFAEQALIDFTRAAALQPACQLIVAPFSHWDFVTLSGWQVITHATVMCVREHLPTRHQPYPVDKNSSAARVDSGTPPWRTPGRTQEELALPVQLCFLGSLRWRGFKAWPPPPTRVATFWLTATKGLQTKPPLLDGDAAAAAGGRARLRSSSTPTHRPRQRRPWAVRASTHSTPAARASGRSSGATTCSSSPPNSSRSRSASPAPRRCSCACGRAPARSTSSRASAASTSAAAPTTSARASRGWTRRRASRASARSPPASAVSSLL